MMLVLQLETILTHLLYDVLSNRELLRRAIGDNGPHTLQAQALRISEIGLSQASFSDPVGLGYQTVYLAQHFPSLPRPVLGGSR